MVEYEHEHRRLPSAEREYELQQSSDAHALGERGYRRRRATTSRRGRASRVVVDRPPRVLPNAATETTCLDGSVRPRMRRCVTPLILTAAFYPVTADEVLEGE